MRIELLAIIIFSAAMALFSVDLIASAVSGHVNEIQDTMEGLENGV